MRTPRTSMQSVNTHHAGGGANGRPQSATHLTFHLNPQPFGPSLLTQLSATRPIRLQLLWTRRSSFSNSFVDHNVSHDNTDHNRPQPHTRESAKRPEPYVREAPGCWDQVETLLQTQTSQDQRILVLVVYKSSADNLRNFSSEAHTKPGRAHTRRHGCVR
jgi:hypothetical protein